MPPHAPTKTTTSKTKRPRWIAERRLQRRDAVGTMVIVRIGSPEWPTGAEEWQCPFIIEGIGDDSIRFGRSIDSMAALQNALIGIRCILEQSGIPLRWEGSKENFTGFPKDLPWDFGLAFYNKIEKMIESEIEVYMQELNARREALRAARKKPKKKTT